MFRNRQALTSGLEIANAAMHAVPQAQSFPPIARSDEMQPGQRRSLRSVSWLGVELDVS